MACPIDKGGAIDPSAFTDTDRKHYTTWCTKSTAIILEVVGSVGTKATHIQHLSCFNDSKMTASLPTGILSHFSAETAPMVL